MYMIPLTSILRRAFNGLPTERSVVLVPVSINILDRLVEQRSYPLEKIGVLFVNLMLNKFSCKGFNPYGI
jgi:hypothetical protein